MRVSVLLLFECLKGWIGSDFDSLFSFLPCVLEKSQLATIENRFGEHLEILQQNQNAALSAKEMNAKFASSSAVFEGAYGKIDEFLGGITEHVGLPAANLMKGMENNFCHGNLANTKFTTSNYEGTTTTAAQEFEHEVKPDLTVEYPRGRRATDVDVYLLAAGATHHDDSERLNMKLAGIAIKFGTDMLDSVQTVLLCKAKEAFMTAQPLQCVAADLKAKSKTNPWNTPSLVQVVCWQDETHVPLKLRSGRIVQFGSHDEMMDLEVVLCEPEQANTDILNAAQLEGKVVISKEEGCPFIEKVQRIAAAGARGLVIPNSKDTVFTAQREGQCCAGIPVVTVKAKDADALIAFGNSSFLYSLKKQGTDKTQVVVYSFAISSGNVRGSCQDTRGTFIINRTESNGHVEFEKSYDSATLTAAVTAIFCSLDSNGNGALSLEEFKPWIQGELQGLSEENVEKILSIFDKSHNYLISEAEFLQECTDRLDMLPSLSHLMSQTCASKTGHDTAGPYIAGTWAQGSRAGEFRLNLSAASQAQHQHRIEVLEGLASRGTDNLKAVRKVVTSALKDATQKARVDSTGGTSFRAVATALAGVLSCEELEVLLELVRANLIAANLVEEEIIRLRLYTGPSYMFINVSLRQVTTNSVCSNVIHVICSGLTKLSTVTSIPEGWNVFWGLGGMRLPSEFWLEDCNGAKGGCERMFLSTTTDMEVAINYLGDKMLPTIFSIECGAVDKGACISWLSQFPEEDEVLMLPCSFLEVVGTPVVRLTKGDVQVLEISQFFATF